MSVTVRCRCSIGIRLLVKRGLHILEVAIFVGVVFDLVALLTPHVVQEELHLTLKDQVLGLARGWNRWRFFIIS